MKNHNPVMARVREIGVKLRDGETSTKLKGVRHGRLTPEKEREVSNELMRLWMSKVAPTKA